MFDGLADFFWRFQVSSGSSGQSAQSISNLSSSSLLTASSATGFGQRKTLRLVDDLRSDVDTVLLQTPMLTTTVAANQADVAANHSEVSCVF